MGTISRAGLGQIAACDLGTLATTPVDPLAMGIRMGAPFKTSAFKPIKDYLNRGWRNMVNFNVGAESMQATMFMLKKMHDWLNMNCDLQVLTNIQSAGGNPDCFKFIGNSIAGLDYELMISSDKRTLKPTWEIALPFDDAKTLIDSADSETPVSLTGITGKGEDQTLLRKPFFVSFEFPKATTVLTRDEIMERSISIKTKNTKSNENNMSIVDYISFEIMMKFRNASVAKKVEIMAKDNAPSLYLKEMNAPTFFDAFDFAAGVLTLDDEWDIDDQTRSQTLKFVADVYLYDISFQFGTTYGGDASDEGKRRDNGYRRINRKIRRQED